ncbi:hypothetical protein Pcinc_044187 [Petrolisthes cinctipes]|uniref:Uncharacterized protein n=1 Tax=Petrolisthes cinctipes TaxID=88211 RepID=A0AAE1EFI1_PETCI|nr:hypothetical protein Pcinc_044187 [Petrolisthes cinctipes]
MQGPVTGCYLSQRAVKTRLWSISEQHVAPVLCRSWSVHGAREGGGGGGGGGGGAREGGGDDGDGGAREGGDGGGSDCRGAGDASDGGGEVVMVVVPGKVVMVVRL